jgi:flagellar basal-body rod protein FlgC
MNPLQKLFSSMRTASAGMAAERVRMDVIARNIANAQVTRTEDGGPYRREVVTFASIVDKHARGDGASMPVARVAQDMKTPFEMLHKPDHPDADADGMVRMPNVNPTQEMADLIASTRAYEANMNAQDNFVRMAERALRMAQ